MGGSNSNSNSSNSSSKGNNVETTNKRRLVRRRLGPNTTIPSSFRIDISLLDISNDVQSDPEASHLRNRIQQHLRTSTVYSANHLLAATDFGTRISSSSASLSSSSTSRSDGKSTMSTADTIRHHILRFLKTQDKYTAFVSILLKNQAFHEIYNNDDDDDNDDDDNHNVILDEEEVRNNNGKGNINTNNENRRQYRQLRPIVDLPRTEYKKPYIPLPWNNSNAYWKKRSRDYGYMICDGNNNNKNDDDDDNLVQNNHEIPEEDVFSFSISHQFPFVGMAQIIMHGTNNNDKIMMTGKEISLLVPVPVKVGLDIVTFDDEIIKRLYSSQEEFLDVFRDSFTKNEWEIGIQDPTLSVTNKLKEFYVRWSMKEAYTKAIGIGMGLQFNTFEISLIEEIYYCDNDDDDSDSDSNTIHYISMKSVWCRIVSQQQQQQHQTNNPDNFSSCDEQVFDFVTPITVVNHTSCFHGRIRFLNNKEKGDEFFFFYFLPLKRKGNQSSSSLSSTVSTQTVNVGEGCACVCVGPFQEKISHIEEAVAVTETVLDSFEEWRNCINISWTGIDQLVHHQH